LCKKFKNKFIVVNTEAGQASSSPASSGPEASGSGGVEDGAASAAEIQAAAEKGAADIKPAPLGANVTILFGAAAKDKPYTIHKNGDLHDIVSLEGVKQNPDPLTKELVINFLANAGA
jgi:hypothetical protein